MSSSLKNRVDLTLKHYYSIVTFSKSKYVLLRVPLHERYSFALDLQPWISAEFSAFSSQTLIVIFLRAALLNLREEAKA